MDFNQFLRERRPRWKRLGSILDRIDGVSIAGLSPREVDEFFALYRLVSSDLNLVQTRTGNPALLEYLEGLVGRAYANLAAPSKKEPLKAYWDIIRNKFPETIRIEKALFGIAAAAMIIGIIFGFAMTYAAPDTASVFLPAEHLDQSPKERVAELEQKERGGETRINSAEEHAVFSTFLFTHNIRVMTLGFALGLTFGIGTIIILFYNGAVLGSIAALYLQDGVITFFIGWVGPHGSIELPCILFGATAGLMMARAQFNRDQGSFRSQLRAMRPALMRILVGAATLLVIAGLIEGGFSQVNEPTIPYILKICVAAALFTTLMAYLFVMPIKASAKIRMKDEG